MKVTLICTDKGVNVEADILSHKRGQFLDVAMNTVKIRLIYKNGVYVGNKAGLEFVIKEIDVPDEFKKQWSR